MDFEIEGVHITLTPVEGRSIVQRINKNLKSDGGIIVLRQDKEETDFAHVIDPGTHESVKAGDKIVVNPHCGFDFTFLDNHNLTIMKHEDILLVVE